MVGWQAEENRADYLEDYANVGDAMREQTAIDGDNLPMRILVEWLTGMGAKLAPFLRSIEDDGRDDPPTQSGNHHRTFR